MVRVILTTPKPVVLAGVYVPHVMLQRYALMVVAAYRLTFVVLERQHAACNPGIPASTELAVQRLGCVVLGRQLPAAQVVKPALTVVAVLRDKRVELPAAQVIKPALTDLAARTRSCAGAGRRLLAAPLGKSV
jgi:hypothetical protein